MQRIERKDIDAFEGLKGFETLYCSGNRELLQKPKISIVGARKASKYAREQTYMLAREFAQRGYVIVSGGAMGIDTAAHRGAGSAHTIAVLGSGIDIKYPAINRELLEDIEKSGLLLSRFEKGFRPTRWSFVVRNELVVALGEILIIAEAQKESGSMRSAQIALKQGKKIYVLPHRLGESTGTNELLRKGLAEPIYDLESLVESFGHKESGEMEDDFTAYVKTSPMYEDAIRRYKERIFEAELLGIIEVRDCKIVYKGS